MRTQTLLQKLEQAARQRKLEKFSLDSYKWFQGQASRINRAEAKTDLLSGKKVGVPRLGHMYCYKYDPKYKDELPYYDMFPMGFIVDIGSDHWTMLNMHYLPPKARAILFDRLLALSVNTRNTERMRLRMTYSILKGASKYKFFQPCFKKYLFSHLKSKIVEIPSDQWEVALFLPVQEFKKQSAAKVWSESMKKAGK